MSAKENDHAALNKGIPGMPSKLGKSRDTWKPMGSLCSAVIDESSVLDEEFTSDIDAISKRMENDNKSKRTAAPDIVRRHSLANTSKLTGSVRANLGLDKRIPLDRRVSLGGNARLQDPYDEHVTSELKDELHRRVQLDQTRQQRLNTMDIKLKQAKLNCEKLKEQCEKERKAKDEALRQLADMKRSYKMIRETLKRKDEQLRKLTLASGGPASVSSLESDSKRSSTGGVSEFRDAEDIFSARDSVSPKEAPETVPVVRRYTMGPGEVSRLRLKQANKISTSSMIQKPSRFVRVDGLDKSYNSQKLLELVKEFGGIASLRVTSDVVTGVHKGYITFLRIENAEAAIRGLRENGYKAIMVDSA